MFNSKNTTIDRDLLCFYRLIMNQSLYDFKRKVDNMSFIDNSIDEPEKYKSQFKTVITLLNTYLGVCDTVYQLINSEVSNVNKK